MIEITASADLHRYGVYGRHVTGGRTHGKEAAMLGFISEELVETICRDRADEARRVRPHTERRPDPERMTHEADQRRATPQWVAPALRHSV